MKVVFRFTLLITLAACLLSSCKSQKTYQDYYNAANRSYNNGVDFDKPKPKKAKVEACCGNCDNNAEYYAYIASITKNVNAMNAAIDKLESDSGLVKKNSNSVRLETSSSTSSAPKQKALSESPRLVAPVSRPLVQQTQSTPPRSQAAAPQAKPEATRAEIKPVTSRQMPDKPKESEQTLANVNVPVRKRSILALDDAEVHKYSIVIATLSKKENASKLTRTLKRVGEDPMVVQNNLASYYVLMGTSDNEVDILQKKDEVYKNYVDKYTPQQLFKTYGIPFSDVWILEKE